MAANRIDRQMQNANPNVVRILGQSILDGLYFDWVGDRHDSNSILPHRFLHDPSRDIGQAFVAARVAVCQLLVIEPEQVQNRRVEIVDEMRFSTAFRPNSSVAPTAVPPLRRRRRATSCSHSGL